MLFDYEVNQYWRNNQYQNHCKFGYYNKSILSKSAPMHIIFNHKDDWQVQLSDKIRKLGVTILKDNKEWNRHWFKIRYNVVTKEWNFRDIKSMFSNEIHARMNQQSINDVSIGHSQNDE